MSSHTSNSPVEDREQPSHESIIDNTPVYAGSLFVGSPEQITNWRPGEPSIPRVRPMPSLGSITPSSSRRPTLEHRSFSHAPNQTMSERRDPNSIQGSITPGRLPLSSPRSHQHQWSLFEQLMENEGQLRTPVTPRARRRFSGDSVGRSDTLRHATSEANLSDVDPFGDSVPSPVQEHGAHDRPFSSHVQTPPVDLADCDDSDSDEASIRTTRPARAAKPSPLFSLSRIPALPVLWRNILKCSIAYFIASLFTFSPHLSGFMSDLTSTGDSRPSPSGHMVATIAVYYNPAKTIGGMVEADSFCSIALLYSALACLSGMSLFWFLEVRPGWEWLADVLAILWVGLSMSGLAWMKVWMAKPTFNTACSMAAVTLFIVIVKEGGWETLLGVSAIILVGAVVSNVVCFFLWPQSATKNLQANMTKTLDSFSTLLGMLTNSFLLEEPIRKPSHEKIQKAVENHQSSFTSLKKNLGEARSEWFSGLHGPGNSLSRRAYEDAVDSLTRLAQHLNGLRSGTRLQYELTKAQSDGKLVLRRSTQQRSMTEADFAHGKGKLSNGGTLAGEDADEILLQAAADMFGDLVDDVGPPLKALSMTCTSSLKRLREAFANSRLVETEHAIQPRDFHDIIDGIERSLFTFESTSNHAVLRLYRRSEFATASSRNSIISSLEENSVLTSSENEHIFLVYFFIFTLQEFARELVSLTDAMRRIYGVEQSRASQGNWWQRYITGGPKSVFCAIRSFGSPSTPEKFSRPGLPRRLSTYFNPHRDHKVSFPKVRPHAPNTMQTPNRSNLTFIGRVKRSLWDLGARLKERNIKYAIKVGMSTAILAAPAFFDATRPLFMEYRGEWALISFFAVISPTIGATNFLSVHRVLGTLFAAIVAATVYTLFPDNAVVLSVFGFFFSIPCFYYIVGSPEYATTGRFVLLTYNLTCLYAYNVRGRDISVVDIAYHRSAAVTVGVLWAALVSRFWWPAEARRELSKALGEFCLNLGWLYTRLVASNSGMEVPGAPENSSSGTLSPDERTPLLSKSASAELNNSIQEFMAMELHLQIKLIELQDLLAQTQHEPRLKGPFPVLLYRSILTSLQTILDKLHSMRCVTTREEWFTSVRKDFILPVNKERHEMVGNIVLYFSTLASAFRLKAPLPPYLPPAEKARERLVEAIRKLDVVKNRDAKASRQLLFFAYALTMKGVTQELDYLGRTLQNAFGVIGQTPEEFEALFADQVTRDVVEQNV